MSTHSRRVDHATPSHDDLARRVRIFLHGQNNPEVRTLKVEVQHDVVVVRGHVKTRAVQQLASDCCRRVAGVRRVVNETTVLPA